MSNRSCFKVVAAAVVALALRVPAQSSRIDAVTMNLNDEVEVLSYLAPPFPPPVEWAFLQGDPADGRRKGPGGPRRGPGRVPGRGFNGPAGNARPLPPRVLDRLRTLQPADRERVLQNNPRFRELPPERKAELLNRLNMLLEMNENERRALDRRLSVFRNLTPLQRRKARQIYENHWRTLAPERRMAILEEFRNLQEMSPEERGTRTSSEEFQTQFNADERALLEELATL